MLGLLGGFSLYPYHNAIKSRIKKGELVFWEHCKNYKSIGECILIHFSSPPFTRPIRPYRYVEYMDILKNYPQRGEEDES